MIVSLPEFDSDTWNRLMDILWIGRIVYAKGTDEIAVDEMKKKVVKLAESLGIKLGLEKNCLGGSSVSTMSGRGFIRVRNLKDMMSTSTSAENNQGTDLTCIQPTGSQDTATNYGEDVIVEKEIVQKLRRKKLKISDRGVSVRNLFEECFGEIEEEDSSNDDHNYIRPGIGPVKPIRIQSVN